VLAAEERKFRELASRGRSLLPRLYPSGRLTEEDYEFLHDTHGLPRELITELLGESAEPTQQPDQNANQRWQTRPVKAGEPADTHTDHTPFNAGGHTA